MEEEEKMKTEGSEVVNFTVKFNKTVHEISWESCRPISSLKEHIQKLTDVPISMQKLMYKGLIFKFLSYFFLLLFVFRDFKE